MNPVSIFIGFLLGFILVMLVFRRKAVVPPQVTRDLTDAVQESQKARMETVKMLELLGLRCERVMLRLESYPRRMRDVMNKVDPFRKRMRECFESMKKAIDDGKLEDAALYKHRGLAVMEEIEALMAEADQLKELWDEDDEELERLVNEMSRLDDEGE